MSDAAARIKGAGREAYCYSCGTVLAMRGATVRLASKLVPRPDTRDGLPRFGLPRREGRPRRAVDFLADASTRDIGNPARFYVNCPTCDRGQVVRWP